MRSVLLLLCAGALPLMAEEIHVLSGGQVEAATDLPGFVRIRTQETPPSSYLVRVQAISSVEIPRPDRPGDQVVIIVPQGNDVRRFVIPVRSVPAETIVAAMAKAVALGNAAR